MTSTMLRTADRRLPSEATADETEIYNEAVKRIRLHCWQQRIRIEQFLHDFDKSRSGSVTKERFKRAMHMSGLTSLISEAEYEIIFKVYPARDVQRINYSAFCEEVDEVFTKKRLEKDPTSITSTNLVSSILQKTTNKLTDDEQNTLDKLNASFAAETKAHGLVLKTCFMDFDKHRSGKIRAPQFERALPFKVDAKNLQIIIKKYTDKATDGVNYLRWIQEVERFDSQAGQRQDIQAVPVPQKASNQTPSIDVEHIIVDLRRQIKQSRIRMSSTMRDYDRLRTGFITPGQFRASLGQLRLQRLPLTEHTLGLLCGRYAVKDSQGFEKIAYTAFVTEMESAFTTPNMEKDPSLTMELNPEEHRNNPTTVTLSEQDESRVACIMEGIKSLVKSRRILLKPSFQDFDRATMGIYQTRATSRRRFERVLALNNINLSEAEYELLERKYATPRGPDSVNYVLFCNHLEEDSTSKSADIEFITTTNAVPQKPFIRQGKTGILSLEEVMRDIKSQVVTQRIRISEFLRDFDKLRSGLIVEEQFASGLSMAGIKLDPPELVILVKEFASEKRKNYVRWTTFCNAVDMSNGKQTLSNESTNCVPAAPQNATMKSPEMIKILEKLREVVRTRGILLPPFFKDFDVHNTGQITVTRLAQSLARHGLPLLQTEIQVLTEYYQDPRTRDVCYRKLIRDIDETESTTALTQTQLQNQSAASHRLPVRFGFSEPDQECTVETLLEEIRSKVVKDSIRVRDFFTYADKLRKGVVPKSKFRTGIDGSGMRLSEKKLQMLENEFMCEQRGGVDYIRFSDEVSPDSLDRHLEKNPGMTKVPYKPSSSHPLKSDRHPLSETETALVESLLDRLRTLTRTRRILPKPTFLDFDKIRKGYVSANQFTAALDKLQLRLTPEESEHIIHRYETSNGFVNYVHFCNAIDP